MHPVRVAGLWEASTKPAPVQGLPCSLFTERQREGASTRVSQQATQTSAARAKGSYGQRNGRWEAAIQTYSKTVFPAALKRQNCWLEGRNCQKSVPQHINQNQQSLIAALTQSWAQEFQKINKGYSTNDNGPLPDKITSHSH